MLHVSFHRATFVPRQRGRSGRDAWHRKRQRRRPQESHHQHQSGVSGAELHLEWVGGYVRDAKIVDHPASSHQPRAGGVSWSLKIFDWAPTTPLLFYQPKQSPLFFLSRPAESHSCHVIHHEPFTPPPAPLPPERDCC